jgi:hypothetical protein
MDQSNFQKDLNTLYHWAEENNKKFNGTKFELISYGKINNRHYKAPDGKTIKRKTLVKDLGVHMSADCKFDEHIKICIKEAQKVAGWTLRTFRTREKQVLRTLLKSIVTPTSEYASVLWSPTNAHWINALENIQRRYTSRISEYQTFDEDLQMPVCTTDYWERLNYYY